MAAFYLCSYVCCYAVCLYTNTTGCFIYYSINQLYYVLYKAEFISWYFASCYLNALINLHSNQRHEVSNEHKEQTDTIAIGIAMVTDPFFFCISFIY